jgi:ElaA protein
MSLRFEIKAFNELSLVELYQILSLRSEVFIVEQNCPYQDVDGKDEKAIHVIGRYNGTLVAYARLFNSGDYFDNASIGRVVLKKEFRNRNLGHELMREAIAAVKSRYNQHAITISAQHYLLRFYQQHGFEAVGDIYPEDDIPHIRMIRS